MPNIECNKIVELATDRLVFLSGKGDRQTEIDFVIQPYREYFAALYLSNHTEAVPDKVFECLVERGPFWLNVLQFYVALAKPAQQFAWVHRAVERPQQVTGVNKLILEVEYQRATLATLAEYVDFPQAHFQKGISIAFPSTNWWTWVGQEWAVPIVRSSRSGDAWRALLKTAEQIDNPTHANAVFTLWLLPQVIPQTAPEHQTFLTLVTQFLKRPDSTNEAVATTLLYNLPVSLTDEHEESLVRVMSEYPYQRRLRSAIEATDVFARLPRRAALRLLCSDAVHFPSRVGLKDAWSFLELPVEMDNEETIEGSFSPDQEIVVTSPQWTRMRIADQAALRLDSQPQLDDPYEAYLMTLFEALQQPNDASLYFKAQSLENTLPHQLRWNIRSVNVLGPSPDEFDRDEEWATYKNSVQAFFKDPSSVKELNMILGTYRHSVNKSEHSWSTLLFHPKHWHLLPSNGLISTRELERLLSREWAQLMGIPNRLIELYTRSYVGYFGDEQWTLPLLPILRVAVSIQNSGQLDASTLATTILLQADLSKLKATEMHELIDSIQDASTLPESWAHIIVAAAIFTQDIDSRRLAKLWKVLNGKRPMYLGRSPLVSPSEDKRSYLLSQLLENRDDDSLDLAAAISHSLTKVDDKISRALNERLAGALKVSERRKLKRLHQIYALLSSRTTLAESRLYSDVEWFKAAAALSPYVSNRIAEKIVTMPQTLARTDYPSLQVSLEKLIDPASGYTDGVAAAALNALIQMDIANRAPLSETMWQLANLT